LPKFSNKQNKQKLVRKQNVQNQGVCLRFGVAVLCDTVNERHDEVDEEVESDKADEQPVRLGARQLRLLQVHGEEDADDAQDLGRIA
jgi:hypothetical protein